MNPMFSSVGKTSGVSGRKYFLMNKDTKIASFTISEEYGEEVCTLLESYRLLPYWIDDTGTWVSNRSAAKHRKHVKDILRNCGGETLSGFITLTHCLSLNDTLWVKSENESVKWSDVSLYTNDFSEVVSKLSFDGSGLYGEKFSITSPELTTDGSYDKCWVREDNTIRLIKAGSEGGRNTGLEPFCEVLASPIYRAICDNSVIYSLSNYHYSVVSKCNLFTSEEFGYRPISDILKTYTNVHDVLEVISKHTDVSAFKRMIIADGVCLNSDRHFGNFGFLINNDTFEIIGMAPAFDFNLSFVPYAEFGIDFPVFEEYLRERGPFIGNDYVSVAREFLDSSTRAVLINLKDFVLTCETNSKLTKQRLDRLNEIKNIQIDKILGRTVVYQFTN